MKILVHNRTEYEVEALNIEYVSLEELFSRSDIISLHARLNDENERIIGNKYLSLMKQNAFLVNTARGGLINEEDLIAGLKAGKPLAAAIDVTTTEPLADNSELRLMPNCVITPHVACSSTESLNRLADITVQNISAFYQGNPQNVVN